jgi:hypothetical protein
VQVVVGNAKDKYDSDRKDSKARRWLDSLSQRIHFYSGILDVIAQHHPEYVALAWGSIKFLLVVGCSLRITIRHQKLTRPEATINHEKIVRTLAKAIALFAEALPRVGLQSSLYPTKQMKEAVTKLYVAVFQFFARARQWYQANHVQRFIDSITHPVELRYTDLLSEVADCSRTIDLLSHCGAQAETRDMHRAVQVMQVETRETQRTVQTLLSVVEKINTTTSCKWLLFLHAFTKSDSRSDFGNMHKYQRRCFRYTIWSDDGYLIQGTNYGPSEGISVPSLLAKTEVSLRSNSLSSEQLLAISEAAKLVVYTAICYDHSLRELSGTTHHAQLLCRDH